MRLTEILFPTDFSPASEAAGRIDLIVLALEQKWEAERPGRRGSPV